MFLNLQLRTKGMSARHTGLGKKPTTLKNNILVSITIGKGLWIDWLQTRRIVQAALCELVMVLRCFVWMLFGPDWCLKGRLYGSLIKWWTIERNFPRATDAVKLVELGQLTYQLPIFLTSTRSVPDAVDTTDSSTTIDGCSKIMKKSIVSTPEALEWKRKFEEAEEKLKNKSNQHQKR